MRYTLISIFVLSWISATGLAEDIKLPHVLVWGTAETKLAPDKMNWSLKITNKANSLELAAQEHTKTVQSILSFLDDQSIPEKNIQTSRMSFGENWELKNGTRVLEGYYAQTNLIFSILDLSKYQKIWTGLAKLDQVSIQWSGYDLTNRIEIRDETREKAILAGKAKAIAMAKTLGSSIGEPLLIEEDIFPNEYGRGRSPMSNYISTIGGSTDGPGIAPGQISVTARVKLAFRLITLQH